MAAITIADGVVGCAAEAVTTVVAAEATRVAGVVQNHSEAVGLMMRLGADPSASVGYELKPGESVGFGGGVPGQGNNTDTYQGDVRIYNPSKKVARVFFMEGTVP